MGEKKFDYNSIRKYWFGREGIFRHVFTGASTGAGISGKLVTFFVSLSLVFVAGMGVAFGVIPVSIYAQQINNFLAGLSASCFSGVIFLFWFFVMLYKVPAEVDFEKQKTIDSYTSEKLKIFVDKPASLIYDNWGAEPPFTVCLPLNVISGEKQKIVDLEAHLLSVDYLTEAQTSVWNHNPYIKKTRLEWEGGKFQVELKPGIQELKNLRIAVLNCSNREFKFSHENNDRVFPSYQVNAIYRVEIGFQGRLEGSYDYRSFSTIADFVCVPAECELGYLPETMKSPKLPEVFRNVVESSYAT